MTHVINRMRYNQLSTTKETLGHNAHAHLLVFEVILNLLVESGEGVGGAGLGSAVEDSLEQSLVFLVDLSVLHIAPKYTSE